MPVRVQEAASLRLDEIYRYTCRRWGTDQADRYITELFAAFDKIEIHGVTSRPIPAEFTVEGFYFRHAHHFVYWKRHAARGQITPPHFHEIAIYDAAHEHANDTALVMVFRKN